MSDFSNRVDNLLTINKMKRIDLVRATGISESTIRGWVKSIPNVEYVYKLSKFFNVSMEYLATGEMVDVSDNSYKMSNNEIKLIDIYRKLDDRDKNSLITLAEGLIRQYGSMDALSNGLG